MCARRLIIDLIKYFFNLKKIINVKTNEELKEGETNAFFVDAAWENEKGQVGALFFDESYYWDLLSHL